MAFLLASEAAAKLRLTTSTLAQWRWYGKGPKFTKLRTGAIRYDEAEVDRWLEGQTYVSTTEAMTARRGADGERGR